MSNDQERIKKAYIRLYGLKEGLARPKTEYLDKAQAVDFNRAIDDLVAEDFAVDEFRIQDNEIEHMAFGPPAVRWDTFITRLTAVLAYFTVAEAKIGFEGPRKVRR
jgi:hypothetical protein